MAVMLSPTKDRNGTYILRKGVPVHLRSIVGKSELKRSLRTKDHREAKRLAPALTAELDAVIHRAEQPLESESLFTEASAKTVVFDWFSRRHRELLQDKSAVKAEMLRIDGGYEQLTGEIDTLLDDLSRTTVGSPRYLTKIQQLDSALGDTVSDALSIRGLSVSPTHERYPELVISLAESFMKLNQLAFKSLSLSLSTASYGLSDPGGAEPVSEFTPIESSMSFKELFDRYAGALRIREPGNADNRLGDYATTASRFVSMYPSKGVKSVSKRDVAAFRGVLERLPSRAKADIKSLALEEQVKKAEELGLKRITQSSVRKQMQAISAVFTFAVKEKSVTQI